MKELSASSACPGFNALRHSRRHALKVGGMGLLGLTLPKLLQGAEAARRVAGAAGPSARLSIKPRAKSVIFLFQYGGPSHLDTFDMKPQAPQEFRGPYRPIATNVPGIEVCELLPRLARCADKYAIVRSLHHDTNDHGIGGTVGEVAAPVEMAEFLTRGRFGTPRAPANRSGLQINGF